MRIHHAHALCSAVLCLPLFITLGRAPAAPVSGPPDDAPPQAAESDGLSTAETGGEIVLQIVYDNNPHDDRLQTEWGFGCVITGCEKTILFDTGGEGDVLLSNMRICGIDPSRIDAVVLSHIHGDHTGGLDEFLQVNPDVEVYLPKVFPVEFKAQVR